MKLKNTASRPTGMSAASILITEDCNLACTYCFELGGRNKSVMSKEVAEKSIDFLIKEAKKDGQTNVNITLFGGEPLMAPDICEHILDYGYKETQKNNLKFSGGIITNGTIMNKSIERWMTKYANLINFFIQVSVDGKQDMHDFYRKTVTGKPSFHLIEKNIPRFKKIMKGHEGALSVHGVINKSHLPSLFENYRFFKEEWKMDNIWFMPLHEESWEEKDVNNYISELEKIKEYIVDTSDFKTTINQLNAYSPLKNCFRNIASSAPCSAGKTYGSINTEGEIHPCHHIYFNNGEEMKIGDVFTGIDDAKRRLFLDYGSSDLTCDKDCKAVSCYRCVAANMEFNGSPLNQIRDLYCDMSKKEADVLQDLREMLHEQGYYGKLHFFDKVKGKNVSFKKRWTDNGEYFESYSVIGKPESEYIYKAPLSKIPGTIEYKLKESQDLNERLLEEVISLIEENRNRKEDDRDSKIKD